MKTCSKCKVNKELSEFYVQSDRVGGTSMCKTCFNQYCIERWRQRKLKAIAYKGGSCIKCGYDKHPAALHFHHRNPSTKTAVWTKMRLWSWVRTLKELDKCDLLCANCHAEHHN